MATTDTRSGFRLPWSSDRSRDEAPPEAQPAVDDASEAVAAEAEPIDASDGSDVAGDETWPEVDVNARLGRLGDADASAPPSHPARSPEEPRSMADVVAAPASVPVAAPRKPSKLIMDLAAAMRTTAQVAREQAMSQVEADAKDVVEQIRARSTEGAAALRQRSDDDIAGIRDWSKAEIARIREETDRRISERKASLEGEIAAHAAAIERQVEDVQSAVAAYETDMAEFFERLLQEDDPARLATMAEAMPDAPTLALWDENPELDLTPARGELEAEAVAVADLTDETEAVAVAEPAIEPDATEAAGEPATSAEVDAETGTLETDDEQVGDAASLLASDDASDPTTVGVHTEAEATASGNPWAGTNWGDSEGAWRATPATSDAIDTAEPADAATLEAFDESTPLGAHGADGARWADADGGTSPAEGGELVDRGSIMAALEAAAEAVVAAEAAAESADQAEAAADVAETAAELIVGGRADVDDEAGLDPDAAFAARLDAGGFSTEPSLADRLASLLPGAGADATPTTTSVVVTGLVSVASIASFKRHLGRLPGVQSVSVSSGPDGEFMFSVAHRADSTFRDAIATLPGFAARVTGTGEGVVNVTARDPETEG